MLSQAGKQCNLPRATRSPYLLECAGATGLHADIQHRSIHHSALVVELAIGEHLGILIDPISSNTMYRKGTLQDLSLVHFDTTMARALWASLDAHYPQRGFPRGHLVSRCRPALAFR